MIVFVVVVQPNYPDEYYHHIVVVDDDIFYDYSAFYSVWLESNPTLGIWVEGTTTNENQIKSKKT